VSKPVLGDTSKELTDIEFERITGIAFPGLALIFGLQSWFSEKQHQPWQYKYLIGLGVGVGISFVVRRTSWSKIAYFPLILFMLFVPLALNSPSMKPWMSLGLLTFAVSAYLSAVSDLKVVLPQMIFVTLIQFWLVRKNLPCFTDTRDMNLLHTYFSTTYTLGIGIAVYLIRTRYVLATKAVDDKIGDTLDTIMSEMKRLSRINRQDQRNLKLHGTTLNTLIFFKNNRKLLKSKRELSDHLRNEIKELASITRESHGSMKDAIKVILENRTRNRVVISSLKVIGEFHVRRTHETVLEIIREVLLNLEKHTNASSVGLVVRIKEDDSFNIKLTDDSQSTDTLEAIKRAESSLSLKRLLTLANATLQVSTNRGNKGLTYEINGTEDFSRTNPEKIVLELRNAALNQFAIDVIKVGIFFALVDLVGYVFLNIDPKIFILIAATDALIFAYAFRYKDSKLLFRISSVLPLLLFPLASINVTKYSQVAFFPTLFNLVLSASYMVALESRSAIFRWAPLTLFTLESIFIPHFLPSDSQDIFAGSTPAIPLITFFAISIIRIRKRVAEEDTQQIRQVFENQENIREIDKWLDEEYAELIKSLEEFVDLLEHGNLSETDLSHQLNLKIQYIRSLLICSEHIESELVRDLFRRLKARYQRGLETRISLNGENFFQFDDYFNFNEEFNELAKNVSDIPFDLNLIRTDKLSMEFKFPKLNPNRKSQLSKTIKKLDSKVNYLISVG
jgi:hypothetical protein